MTQNEICPNCRSTYQIVGHLDFGAQPLQVVNCPVCSQAKWIPSGLFPQQWVVGQVVDRQPVTTPPVVIPPPDPSDPVWTFELPDLGQGAIVLAGQGLYKVGIWIVIVLVLIILIQYEPYFRREK